MRRILIILWCLPVFTFAHEGEEHNVGKKSSTAPISYFSSEAFSDKYELLIKYDLIIPGKEAVLKLFISEYNNNKPLDTADIKISVVGNSTINVTAILLEKGIYQLKATFPEKKVYNLLAHISGTLGADLIQINNIETGKELAVAEVKPAVDSPWYHSNWFFGVIGLLLGAIVMYFLNNKGNRSITATVILLFCLLPTANYNTMSAHDGEDHGNGASKSAGLSTDFIIEKETQFLFNILTEKISTGDFNQSTILLGTVAAAPQGRAVIQSPQTGKIVSLKVNPGQQVIRGQLLAIVEQQVDAGTQISILSQKNIVNGEYEAAKAQYERLKTIEDIAAKKDVTEAKARYDNAKSNKELFDANSGSNVGNTKLVTLTSPISGVVGLFNYSIGAVVNIGETLFEVTNLNKVFAEAQVFTADVAKMKTATSFSVVALHDTLVYKLKMINTAQTVNTGNQSQNVVFEIINPNGQFKIGENINVRMTGNESMRQVVLPNDAITDVNGKPAIFIKNKAEQYRINFIVTGQNNNKYTVVSKGAEDGERVVVSNVYQMKMIYLNQ